MGNAWIRFGCFLTGYNYHIVRNSSEVAAKSVKRYTAAMLIVCILWSFVGYMFTQRYLHGSVLGSIAGAVVMVVIIVQIERQIILSIKPGAWLYVFRGIIAAMMSIIGAIIIDQIIFKDDIDLEKMQVVDERVDARLPAATAELKKQIQGLDSTIAYKEAEIRMMRDSINKRPEIKLVITNITPTLVTEEIDSLGKIVKTQKLVPAKTVSTKSVPNPYIELIPAMDSTVRILRDQQAKNAEAMLNIRPAVKKEIESKVGFLDELKVMHRLIMGSGVAMIVWLLWFFFLVGLELLVLVSKANDKKSDYEDTILHQMNHQKRKLELLSKLAEQN